MAKNQEHPEQPAGPTEHPPALDHAADVAGTLEELEQKVKDLDKSLTKRINDVRTDFTTLETTLTSKIQANEAEIKKLKTATSNNRASIAAMDADVKDAKKAGTEAKKTADKVASDLQHAVDAQSTVNDTLAQKVQEAHARVEEVAVDSHAELLAATSALNNRIAGAEKSLGESIEKVRNAPVKPHKHSITLSGESGPVTGGN